MQSFNPKTDSRQDYTVRANKGKARIWIEGKRLVAAGFTRGQLYNITRHHWGLELVLADDGSRKVCGKGERPLIDLSGSGCDPCRTGDQVDIHYGVGIIAINILNQA
jgi:hypothetical protein